MSVQYSNESILKIQAVSILCIPGEVCFDVPRHEQEVGAGYRSSVSPRGLELGSQNFHGLQRGKALNAVTMRRLLKQRLSQQITLFNLYSA
jgi:hypothetical protein